MKSGTPAPESAVQWIREHAMPLRTDEPDGDFSDLAGLGEALGTTRVVALGEATHGTRQFFQMKHRLLRYLVSEKGFRAFVMEADGAASCEIDNYVRTGRGDPAQLVRGLKFWTWNTQEVVDMIRWMRAYNEAAGPDEAISFNGIDMQNPASLAKSVVSFLERVEPEAARRADAAYQCLGPLHDVDAIHDDYRHKHVQDQVDCARAIKDVHALLAKNRASYERVSPAGYGYALLGARLMVQAEVLLRMPSVRDHYYAENILELLGQGQKVVIWAHNSHIANDFGAMGQKLRKRLGADYTPIGLTFYGGTFRARLKRMGGAGPPVPMMAPPSPADSYEAAFHRVGLPAFLVDLRLLRSTPAPSAWLLGPHPMWSIGGAYDPSYHNMAPSRLPEKYDFLVFFDTTSASEYRGPSRP